MRDEMRLPAKVVSEILTKVASHVRPGVSPFILDCIVEQEIKNHGVYSYNKGYHPTWAAVPFPAATCISVNEVFAHGVPNKRPLKEGDLIHFDLGIIDKHGNCGDAAFTIPVGTISEEDQRLIDYAKKTTYAGIKRLRDGVTVGELARDMERKASERKFVINRQLCSHAIGKTMHDDPIMYNVYNHMDSRNTDEYLEYEKFMDIELKEGMVVCIEPTITFSDVWGYIDEQTGWEFRTKDKRHSAMFEHMVLITKDGYEILTNHFDLPDYSR